MTISKFYNRVMFQAVAGGTGNFIVNTAISGYSTPAQRGVTDGATVSYTAESLDKTQWEVGTGVYTAASTTVARTTIRESSNANLIVNFSASPIVFLDYQAQDIDTAPDWVNVWDFGADPTNTTDSTTAIQAAIDYAYANGVGTIYIPSGNYKVSDSLYLDPPGNLRSNFANPTIFNFSLALIGDPGLPNAEGDGTQLLYTVDDRGALYVGPGQGMLVKDLNIRGPGGLWHIQQNINGIGLGLTGGSGGSTRARIENVFVASFYTSFKTGANNFNALCDSNTFIKCWAYNGYYGFYLAQTQNFINSFIDCQPDCHFGVYNPNGVDVKVLGGNYTASGVVASFAISAVSALTVAAAGNSFNYTFTAVITTPDFFWTGGSNGPAYDTFSFETAHFGVVPCTLVSYVAGTKTATFKIYPMWSYYNFGLDNAKTASDLEAEIQACLIVFAAEHVTAFTGNNFSIDGIHIENPNTPTTVVDGQVVFGSNRPNTIKNLFCNWDPTESSSSASGNPDVRARYMCGAAHFPFFTTGSLGTGSGVSDIRISSCTLGNAVPMMIDIVGNSSLTIDNIDGYLNVRSGDFGGEINATDPNKPYYEAGVFGDTDHFFVFTFADSWRRSGFGFAPMWGWRPAPWTTPAVRSGDVAVLSGVLPTLASPTTCSYPILWGGQTYREAAFSNVPTKEFYSAHSCYSYGQDLTTVNCPGLSWSYKGHSFCVYCNDTNFIFPGLGIKLNDGVSDVAYVVTGTFPNLGYFTVAKLSALPSVTGMLSGLKTTVFTGSTIVQEAYVITPVGRPPGGQFLGEGFYTSPATSFALASTGGPVNGFAAFAKDITISWSSTTIWFNTNDVGITRNAAGVLEVNNGTAGTFRDLKLRNFQVTQYIAVPAPVTKTNDFTVADTETWLINNKAGSTCTVTLPAPASYAGRQITINNYQAQTVVSASANVVPQVGGAAATAILPGTAGKWATLVSDGTNWVIMQSG
jgi:hypothetical protein